MAALDVRARDIDFRCLCAGEGPLVLLFHGFPDDPTSLRPLLTAVAVDTFLGRLCALVPPPRFHTLGA